MTPMEVAIIEKLRRSGPSCLDDVVTYLPHLNWGEIFVAVNCLSRDRRLWLRQISYSTYQIALHSQVSPSSSPSGRNGPTAGTWWGRLTLLHYDWTGTSGLLHQKMRIWTYCWNALGHPMWNS